MLLVSSDSVAYYSGVRDQLQFNVRCKRDLLHNTEMKEYVILIQFMSVMISVFIHALLLYFRNYFLLFLYCAVHFSFIISCFCLV